MNDGVTLAIDGYVGARFDELSGLLEQRLASIGVHVDRIDIADCYKSEKEISELLRSNLPTDREIDPVELFGRLYEGSLLDLIDPVKLKAVSDRLSVGPRPESVRLVVGTGAAVAPLRAAIDETIFMDVIPKDVVLRFKREGLRNLGFRQSLPYKQALRQAYYFDFEVAGKHRTQLLSDGGVDMYMTANTGTPPVMLPRELFDHVCKELSRQPFRCKPVYNEGVWGGQFAKIYRELPEQMRNCAWVFDLIPLEVSVLIKLGDHIMDVPYLTFVKKEGESLMGRECVERFGGYFPIRFNYDDTYHSNGNMSIQVHPTEDYARQHFHEHGRQDESYYVVAVGHEAKTYMGLKDEVTADQFWSNVSESYESGQPIDHDKYVHSVPSRPGRQFMIPAGTIHASGRNQVILEIGSLTVGSYTFKLYDYCRVDLDGKPRPIHLLHGKSVLDTDRRQDYVSEKLVPEPIEVASGEGWREYVIGEHDDVYFSLRRIEFQEFAEQQTNGQFHVLTLVDGESVTVRCAKEPTRSYTMSFLDIVVVPAAVGSYVLENNGTQPIYIHKALLK